MNVNNKQAKDDLSLAGYCTLPAEAASLSNVVAPIQNNMNIRHVTKQPMIHSWFQATHIMVSYLNASKHTVAGREKASKV